MYEPIEFTQDPDGASHFHTDALPLKTVFSVHALAFRFITPHEGRGIVEINLDGKHVVYERVATGPHGEWLCHLRIRPLSEVDPHVL